MPMSEPVLKLYHALPFRVRTMAASLHGLRLRHWRYGSETEGLVAEALEREQWSASDWKAWQANQLQFILHHAVRRVPYYRELWAQRRQNGDQRSWEYIENWPILEKETLRANPQAFLEEGCKPTRMFHVHTSGTTGKSLDLWRSREVERAWYALFEARSRRWYGISRHMRWAILGGQLVTPVRRRRPPFWVWNAALNQLYMSSYHLAPDLVPSYLDALDRYQVTYLCGYPSALYELAQGALRCNRRGLKMKIALTNAEPVFAYQREAIEEAFQCSLRETYGMAEMVAAASECGEGHLHLWPEVAYLEVAKSDMGDTALCGDLLGTGLLNANMPLIRYRVGDRVTLQGADDCCACGRRLPLLTSIEGRLDDMLFTKDGRRIGRLDPVFKAQLPVHEAQIVQETLDRIRVRYVPTADYTPAAGRSIANRLRSRIGNVQVVMEQMEELPRSANGKFRAVVCDLPAELKASLQRSA
jgi:phenylacetate-CoA ligase